MPEAVARPRGGSIEDQLDGDGCAPHHAERVPEIGVEVKTEAELVRVVGQREAADALDRELQDLAPPVVERDEVESARRVPEVVVK
jgi:hypothetical protein